MAHLVLNKDQNAPQPQKASQIDPRNGSWLFQRSVESFEPHKSSLCHLKRRLLDWLLLLFCFSLLFPWHHLLPLCIQKDLDSPGGPAAVCACSDSSPFTPSRRIPGCCVGLLGHKSGPRQARIYTSLQRTDVSPGKGAHAHVREQPPEVDDRPGPSVSGGFISHQLCLLHTTHTHTWKPPTFLKDNSQRFVSV